MNPAPESNVIHRPSELFVIVQIEGAPGQNASQSKSQACGFISAVERGIMAECLRDKIPVIMLAFAGRAYQLAGVIQINEGTVAPLLVILKRQFNDFGIMPLVTIHLLKDPDILSEVTIGKYFDNSVPFTAKAAFGLLFQLLIHYAEERIHRMESAADMIPPPVTPSSKP